MAHGKEKASE